MTELLKTLWRKNMNLNNVSFLFFLIETDYYFSILFICQGSPDEFDLL